MEWFDNWFFNKSKKAWERAAKFTSDRKDISFNDRIFKRWNGSTIRMQKAFGGTIVEISSYDISTDEHKQNLYVIPDDREISDELTSIFIQDVLRKG